ncbi:hypothetical protein [Methylibium sp. T29]|uniref:hypothetical protein n=1 Tax=Methylibium sp. T29 TaxID=1430884 RepID=UPI0003F3F409|nr:hypothetical protein [Methylibium sp. T29]EWS56681.1 hypothetical protein X551_00550 [Methylibium sp. T29]
MRSTTARGCLAAAALIALVSGARAGPMGFDGSQMAMGDFGPNWREAWVNHAYTPRDAIGIGGLFMRSDDERMTRDVAELTYTRLMVGGTCRMPRPTPGS